MRPQLSPRRQNQRPHLPEQSAQNHISQFPQLNWNMHDISLLIESFPPYKKERWLPNAGVATTIPKPDNFTDACYFDTHDNLASYRPVFAGLRRS